MDVRLSELFYIMSRSHGLSRCEVRDGDFSLDRIGLYMGSSVPGTLYVADAREWGGAYSLEPGSGLLLTGAEPGAEITVTGGSWALARGRSAQDLLAAAYDALVHLQSWLGELKDLLLGEDALPPLLPMGRKLLGQPYCVLDQSYSLLYASPELAYAFPAPVLPAEKLSGLIADREFARLTREGALFSYRLPFFSEDCLCLPLQSDRFRAWLILPDEGGALGQDPGLRSLLARFGAAIQRAVPKYYYLETLRHRDDPQHRLFYGILFEPRKYTQADSEAILQPYGWENNHDYVLVKLSYPGGSGWESATDYICARLEEIESQSCAFAAEDGIVWLINRTRSGTSMNRPRLSEMVDRAVDVFSCSAGISYSFKGFGMLREYYSQACQVLNVGNRANPGQKHYYYGDYTLYYALDILTRESPIAFITHPSVVSMLRYDCEHKTFYFDTLRAYAQASGNVTLAAELLDIHRTSFMRRLDRICELLGRDVRTADALFHLELSFRLLEHRYRGLTKSELLVELVQSD